MSNEVVKQIVVIVTILVIVICAVVLYSKYEKGSQFRNDCSDVGGSVSHSEGTRYCIKGTDIVFKQ